MVAIGVPAYDVNGDGIITVNPSGDVPTQDAAATIKVLFHLCQKIMLRVFSKQELLLIMALLLLLVMQKDMLPYH
jgi:hypothetical protein